MANYLETRYLAPTAGGKGARIKVIAAGSRVTLHTFDFDYAAPCAHTAAAKKFRSEFTVEKAFATARGFVFRVTHELEGA
jgi:hypothetical protein